MTEGYDQGVTDKINPVEADAIVDQIEKCIADPRYVGLTFGVVSLLGHAQAKRIEKLLLERILRPNGALATCGAGIQQTSRAPSAT